MLKGKLLIIEILTILFVPGVMTFYIAMTGKKLFKQIHNRKKDGAIEKLNCYTE